MFHLSVFHLQIPYSNLFYKKNNRKVYVIRIKANKPKHVVITT